MIGTNILRARTRLGINQTELAKRTKLTPAAIWGYEHGKREPNAQSLISLSKALGCSTDYILGLRKEASNA